jgi:hypothetical protein
MAEATNTSRSIVDNVLMMDTNSKIGHIEEFDILLFDVMPETIDGLKIDGVEHLSSAGDNITFLPNVEYTLKGIIFGYHSRVLVMALLSKKKSTNAIVRVDTGSPYTFLTEETFKAIGINIEDLSDDDECDILINGQRTTVHRSKAHFQDDRNILGANFLRMCEVFLDYPNKKVQITVKPVLVNE